MSEEELKDLLEINCCEYHREIGKDAKKEIERLNNIINITKNNIEITMQIIKEQPTGNDEWLLERLNGINNILKGKEKGRSK